jgi:hypothetical protein
LLSEEEIMNIEERYKRLTGRRIRMEKRSMVTEAYERESGYFTRYLLGAMAAVDPEETAELVEQGNRVENQLSKRLADEYPGLAFRRQGSVSNGTHIRYYSDVDVLVIIDKFYDLQPPLEPTYPYRGDVQDDLQTLRKRCADELGKAFWEAKVDDTGSTAVEISGGSLKCSVDVVPSSWYNTVEYNDGKGDHYRGIKVFNKFTGERKANYPFLYNHRLSRHDSTFVGIPRMLIRLLKSIREDQQREDSNDNKFSSFDICSLVYRMPAHYFAVDRTMPLEIVRNLISWIDGVLASFALREQLQVIDDTRKIFDASEKVDGLGVINRDLKLIYAGAVREQGNSLMKSAAHLAA